MISRIEALNYRCLRYVNQPLDRFHVLVGPNASGKSTLLDVVALLGDFCRNGLDEAVLRSPLDSGGRATMVDELIFNQSADRFELAIELVIPERLRTRGNGQHERARYQVAIGRDSDTSELVIAGETLWLCPARAREDSSRAAQLEFFPLDRDAPEMLDHQGSQQTPRGWSRIVNKVSGSGNDYYRSEKTNWSVLFRFGPRKSALAGLPQDQDRFPIAIWVRDLLLQGIHVLALSSAAMRRPSSPSGPRAFDTDGSNLPLVIRDIQQTHPDLFEEWVEHVRTVLPDTETIQVVERQEDRHLYLAVQYAGGGAPVPSWLLSDGTLRMLALTLLAYAPRQQEGIYLIEEPENGIHPKAIEAVFQSLSSVYDGQVLIATHSPLIVGMTDPERILCFGKTSSGAVDIVSGRDHPRLRDWQGETEISTLYASGVLG